MVLDDPRITQRTERLVGDLGRESLVQPGAERDPLDDPLCVAAECAHVSERLLVLEPVGEQGALSAGTDVRDIDPAGRFERGDVVRLLGDQHRRAGVPLAPLDQLLERVLVDRAAVELQPCGNPGLPVFRRDRRQLVEAAELTQRPLGRAEQVAHHVLKRPREQDRDRGRVLQHRP